MAAIKIVSAPTGEAPLFIRQAWIGCVLPLPDAAEGGVREWQSEGVLSGKDRSWLDRLLPLGGSGVVRTGTGNGGRRGTNTGACEGA